MFKLLNNLLMSIQKGFGLPEAFCLLILIVILLLRLFGLFRFLGLSYEGIFCLIKI